MYQYDVFVSYRREPPVSEWVANHFLDGLVEWLGETMAEEPRIFVDVKRIETGTAWPDVLREALLTSRLMVSIWSPRYFRSRWCLAEHRSMRARLPQRVPLLRQHAEHDADV